jgi:hypothetical protein
MVMIRVIVKMFDILLVIAFISYSTMLVLNPTGTITDILKFAIFFILPWIALYWIIRLVKETESNNTKNKRPGVVKYSYPGLFMLNFYFIN